MKFRAILLLLAIVLLFSACAKTDSDVSHSEETAPNLSVKDPTFPIYVNTAAKKIHFDKDCRYLSQSNEENIIRMEYSEETMQSLCSMEFASCDNCD